MKRYDNIPNTKEVAMAAYEGKSHISQGDSFELFMAVLERMPAEFLYSNLSDLSFIYHHFTRNKRITKATSDDKILSMFLTREDCIAVREALRYVHVDKESIAYASDGSVLAMSKSTLSPGFYCPKKGWFDFVAASGTYYYPSMASVRSEVYSRGKLTVSLDPEKIRPTRDNKDIYNLHKIGGFWFDSRYIDKIEACAGRHREVYTTPKGYLVVDDGRFTFVLMHAVKGGYKDD